MNRRGLTVWKDNSVNRSPTFLPEKLGGTHEADTHCGGTVTDRRDPTMLYYNSMKRRGLMLCEDSSVN